MLLLRSCATLIAARRSVAANGAHWLPLPVAAQQPRRASMAAAAAAAAGASSGGGSGGAPTAKKPILRGVVFDMDGTLTVPVIDFALMRRRVGVTQGDILDVINSWPPAERARAHAEIAAIEKQALADMQLMPGLDKVVALLDAAGVPRGLITRNVKSSIEYFHANHFSAPAPAAAAAGGAGAQPPPPRPFEPAISRECAFPYKPSPAALLHICNEWGIDPSEALMVGDSAKDDIVCGNRAGARTALLDVEGRYANAPPHGEEAPTHAVRSMGELAELLRREYQLLPPVADTAAAAAAAAGGSR